MDALVLPLNIPVNLQLAVTPEQFVQLATANQNLQLERTETGTLIVMPPTGSDTGKSNSEINGQLWLWNRQTKLGQTFDSSSGFCLPNGAIRSPDAAWIVQERWDALTPQQQTTFAPICPDFVIELRSKNDDLAVLQAKMQEYIANGVRLAWLIDRQHQQVEIYRPDQPVTPLDHPTHLSGEPVLPGFSLDLNPVWA